MRNQLFKIGAVSVSLILLAGTKALGQSAYYNAVKSLNPVVYFPLQETAQPPIADLETNYGSLGPVGDAIYSSQAAGKGVPGATADGDLAVNLSDANGSLLAVPTTDPRTAVQSPTLTVECWVNPGTAEPGRNYTGILSKSGGNNAGINHANNQAGWCLSENYIAYLDSANLRGFDFHVFNGIGHAGAEVIVPFNVQSGSWYHLVATFDGTNCWLYVNGTNEVTAGNAMQIPMTGSYVPDTWNQLCIGCSRNLNGNRWQGEIDEVAIYTNVLTAAQVAAHYSAASSTSPYSTTILADNPYMYWRMDSPSYTAPDPSTYPVAADDGSMASTFVGIYGTAAQPGVAGPQFPGMLDPNNGNASYGVAINGIGGNNGGTANVPVGFDTSGSPYYAADAAPVIVTNSFTDPHAVYLNPTNQAPLSVALWFKGNPDDWARFKCIVGHSDQGWRVAMNQSGQLQFNPGPGGETHTAHSWDDGTWHQAVCTYDGSNVLTYVDGILESSATTANVNNGSPSFAILGGAPDYLASGNNYTLGTATGTSARNGYNQRNFSGAIAHFAFFTNALTAAQVDSLYAAVKAPPEIVAQPVTGRVNPTPIDYLFFGVVAGGSSPSYQWYFNTSSNYAGATALSDSADGGVKYAGSTTSQVTVSNLVNSDSGYYFVVVTNNYGAVTSILASLQVNYAPVITGQSPATDFSLYQNQEAALSVTTTAETNSPLSYQWYVNNVADPNGTNSSYVSTPITSPGTSFYCIVTNDFGSATSLTVSATTLLPLPAALTNSAFGSNVLALKPTGYWPMHEAGQTPAPADIETNYGSWGSLADGYYGDWQNIENAAMGLNVGGNQNAPTNVSVLHDLPGALAGGSDTAVNFMGANSSWIAIPHGSPQLSINSPFTVEAWVRPNSDSGWGAIVAQDVGALNNGNKGGFELLYSGTPDTFSMTVYNGSGGSSTEPKTTANYPPGQWYHVVAEFDGANVSFYINGVQDSLQNSAAATMNPNTWDPITIGCARGLNNNMFKGSLDEVAVYTNLLSATDIQKHYNDGLASASTYDADVLADSPVLYYRMDSPVWTPPPTNEWPGLTNYGIAAVNGVYEPGAVPGGASGPVVAGVPVAGLSAPNALACNGASIYADAGFAPEFNPTGTTPLTVSAWFRGNPADNRFQNILGHSDASWRIAMDGSGKLHWNAGAGGEITSARVYNDGNWHQVTAVYDGGTNDLYVDGVLDSMRSTGTGKISGTTRDVVLGGDPQYIGSPGRLWAGDVCEAAFWNGVALSPSQIDSLINAAKMAPTIDGQPISATVDGNTAFTNAVVAGGSATLSYQWYKDGVPVSDGVNGSTNASLALNPVQPSDESSDYYVVVANSYGSVTSAVVSLTVNTNLTITQDIEPTNITLFAGGHATFSIAVTGARPYGFQWYSNSVALPGATNITYMLANAEPPNATVLYNCVVTNAYNTRSSSSASVTILPYPTASYPATILSNNPAGYWRLNEPDNGLGDGNFGVAAHDYWGGNNGVYTNTTLGNPPFDANLEPTNTSAQFGFLSFSNCMALNIPNIDFSGPTNAEFSVECWENGYGQNADAGLVTKGYWGHEQFTLDFGAPGNAFRLSVRDAKGNIHNANSTNVPDGAWHYVAGVVDEANGAEMLYVDGALVASNDIPVGSGVLATTVPMAIGARDGDNAGDYTRQFAGTMNDVAVYNYALSPAQVLADYDSADIPAYVSSQPPASLVVDAGGTATIRAGLVGTPPLAIQWYSNSVAIPGATNSTLILSNVSSSADGSTYYVTVQNAYNTGGPVQSGTTTLTVVSGIPQIYVDVPTNSFALVGGTVSIPVTAYGSLPLTYQWQYDGVNLTDGGGITGSQVTDSSGSLIPDALIIAKAQQSEAGLYRVIVANSYGSVTSSASIFGVGSIGGSPLGFNNGTGWTPEQAGTFTAPIMANNILELTDGAGSEARSFFYNTPLFIGSFRASFTYLESPGAGGADGITFCLQNDTRGATALGGGGGSLGVSGITPSWEFEINIYSGHVQGYALATDGSTGTYVVPGNVNVISGDPIDVSLVYAGGIMTVTMADATAGTSFTTTEQVDLPTHLGGEDAYVGFTGADGGVASIQQISNFEFFGLVPQQAIRATTANNTVTITWSQTFAGYRLQENSDLGTTNWVDVTSPLPQVVNGVNQVVVPLGSTNEFYRLVTP